MIRRWLAKRRLARMVHIAREKFEREKLRRTPDGRFRRAER